MTRGRPRGTVIGKHASKHPWKTEEGEFRTEDEIRRSLKEIKMMEATMPKMPEEYVADILEGLTTLDELEMELDGYVFRQVSTQYLKITKAKRASAERAQESEQDDVEREKFKTNIVVKPRVRHAPPVESHGGITVRGMSEALGVSAQTLRARMHQHAEVLSPYILHVGRHPLDPTIYKKEVLTLPEVAEGVRKNRSEKSSKRKVQQSIPSPEPVIETLKVEPAFPFSILLDQKIIELEKDLEALRRAKEILQREL